MGPSLKSCEECGHGDPHLSLCSKRSPTIPICRGCLNQIDPETCGCGASRKGHGNPFDEGHAFVPMGCTCLMTKGPVHDPDYQMGRVCMMEEPMHDPDFQATAWPFPWPKPNSIYDDDGPSARKRGRQFDIVVCSVLFMASPTGDTGGNSGRARYRVDCQDCNMIIHENTTSVSAQVRYHLADRHDVKVRW